MPKPRTEVISTHDAFIELELRNDGQTAFVRFNDTRHGYLVCLERDEFRRFVEAGERLLKASSPSVAEAARRERANA